MSLYLSSWYSSTHTHFRCGSGKGLDCPGGTSHGILCCELDFVATNGGNQTNEWFIWWWQTFIKQSLLVQILYLKKWVSKALALTLALRPAPALSSLCVRDNDLILFRRLTLKQFWRHLLGQAGGHNLLVDSILTKFTRHQITFRDIWIFAYKIPLIFFTHKGIDFCSHHIEPLIRFPVCVVYTLNQLLRDDVVGVRWSKWMEVNIDHVIFPKSHFICIIKHLPKMFVHSLNCVGGLTNSHSCRQASKKF